MANFARGLQAGLPVGLALGEGFRDRRERRAYQEAAQQWTPEETELNLGDAPISGGAPPMARGIGPQMSPEGMQEVETQRLTAPPGSMPRSQTQRRFSLPGAPGEMYGTEADASRAARVRGLEAQRQAAMQLGDIDAANRLAGSIHSMEQDEARTAMAQAREDREQTDFAQRQADKAALDEFTETTAGMSSEERLRAAGDISNHFVRSAVIDQVAAELGITSTQANIRLTNLQMSELEDEVQRNAVWEAFFADNSALASEDPQAFQRLAEETGDSFVANKAREYVSSGLSVEEQQARLDLVATQTQREKNLLEEYVLAQAEEERIKEAYPDDPKAQMQARLDSENMTVRAAALALQNDQQTVESNQLVLDAERRVAAVNIADKAFRDSGGTDFNVFFDSLNLGGGPVSLLPAETDSGRQYYTLGRDTNGDGEYDEVLNYQGTSVESLYQDVLTKNSGVAATVERDLAANRESVKALSPNEKQGIIDRASGTVQDVLMTELKGSVYMTLPEGMSDQQFMDQVDTLQLGVVASEVLEDMQAGVANGRYNSAVDSQNLAMRLAKLEYDPETDTFYIPSVSNPEEIFIAEVFEEGSEARQAAIGAYAKAQEEQEESFRREAYRSLGDGGLSGPAAAQEGRREGEPPPWLLFDAPAHLREMRAHLFPDENKTGWFGPGGFEGSPAGRTLGGLFSQGEGEPPPEPEPERDMADGGLVKASGESEKGKWRERAAAGLRANQQAQRSMEGEVAPSAPLAYQPLNDMSAMERMQRSRVQAPVNMADGGLARKDMRGGGDVSGPGTETSDSIPARLSDGEYVLNAETVKLVGEDYLDKINKEGLRRRDSRKRK